MLLEWWSHDWVRVLVYATITAIATGLGVIPLLFTRRDSIRMVGIGNGIAAGLMLGASFNLLFEGLDDSPWRTAAGALAGVLAIAGSRHFLGGNGEIQVGKLKGADARKAILIVGVMTAHSIAEGVGVGVSFGEGDAFGSFISIAIAVHNIPEGLAIALVLMPRGVSALKAAGWGIFSSLPQPLLALPAFFFVEAFRPFLSVGLGFAGAAMIWMVVEEILPEGLERSDPRTLAHVTSVSVIAMLLFQALIYNG